MVHHLLYVWPVAAWANGGLAPLSPSQNFKTPLHLLAILYLWPLSDNTPTIPTKVQVKQFLLNFIHNLIIPFSTYNVSYYIF